VEVGGGGEEERKLKRGEVEWKVEEEEWWCCYRSALSLHSMVCYYYMPSYYSTWHCSVFANILSLIITIIYYEYTILLYYNKLELMIIVTNTLT
jgi:arylamine N-acetyltransferase